MDDENQALACPAASAPQLSKLAIECSLQFCATCFVPVSRFVSPTKISSVDAVIPGAFECSMCPRNGVIGPRTKERAFFMIFVGIFSSNGRRTSWISNERQARLAWTSFEVIDFDYR